MRGVHRGPFEPGAQSEPADPAAASRRVTPSVGLAPDSAEPDLAANEDFLFHLYRGSELLQDNRAHEAKEELERALHLQPHDAKGQDLLAVVYFRLGLYARAISIYEQLRRSSPRDPALLLNLSLCYLKTGQAGLARRDLELLLEVNPAHTRAWGYLGLACERLGATGDAQRAFEQGGHTQMARRMAERRASQAPPPLSPEGASASREVRDVVATAYEELDAGELSFELAKPAREARDGSADSWRSVELGQMRTRPDGSPLSTRHGNPFPEPDSKNPDTKDGPPPALAASPPALAASPPPPATSPPPEAQEQRRTLMVGVAPPQPLQDPNDVTELEALSRVPSPRPPAFGPQAPSPADARARIPVVRVPGFAPLSDMGGYDPSMPASKRTLQPPPARPPSLPPAHGLAQPAPAPPPAAQLAYEAAVTFPPAGGVVLHTSGVALVRTAPGTGFAARLEALRVSSNSLATKVLERQVKGKPTGEPFGGVGSPLVQLTGEGQLVLAPRAGRSLTPFSLDEEICFVREEVLLGFDGQLTFENGRLATGEGEFVGVVQLRGRGVVLLEAIGDILSLELHGNHGLSVRREVILGWFGRLVPRALAPSEAPCGQRGLVSFAGVGRVLVASA